jgi:hypothetical protein
MHAGQSVNCPACWDPVKAPSTALHSHESRAKAEFESAADPLDTPLPRLILEALKGGMRQHSRYFFAGLLLVFLLLFVGCGGVGVIRNLISPEQDTTPVNVEKPSTLWELRQKTEELPK